MWGECSNAGACGNHGDGSPPISRVLSWAAIPLGPLLPASSSGLPGSGASHAIASLFGLAPDGVCRAVRVATSAVSSYLGADCPAPVRLAAHHHFTLACALKTDQRCLATALASWDFATLRRQHPGHRRYLSVALSVALGHSLRRDL
jgi:hypothetical protein